MEFNHYEKTIDMDYLPKDPAILVSNLFKRGFVWSEQQKQFRPIGYDQ